MNLVKDLYEKLLNKSTDKQIAKGVQWPDNSDCLEALSFINAIVKNTGPELSNVQLIVFESNVRSYNNSEFVRHLKFFKTSNDLPEYIRNMVVLDLSTVLNDNDYYILDGHVNESGHKKIAEI